MLRLLATQGPEPAVDVRTWRPFDVGSQMMAPGLSMIAQLLEAQPDVVDAIRRAGRAKTVRRSILLTPFGMDFCETCLPLEMPIDTAEFRAIRTGAAKQDPPAPGRG